MEEKNRSGWTAGKVLAVVVPICVVVAAVAVSLVLVLAGDNDAKEGAEGATASEEEMLETYENIQQEADAALAEMEDLESEEAASDPQAYEQGLEEALAAYDQLIQDLDEAAQESIEVSEEYEELYAYIYEYYDYLYELTDDAVAQIQYLLSVVPTVEEMQQLEELLRRAESLPSTGKYGPMSEQIDQAVQKVLSSLESAKVPAGSAPYEAGIAALWGEFQALSQQIASALAAGNQAALGSLAQEMGASISSLQAQMASAAGALASGFANTLSGLEAEIQSLMP